MRITIFYAHYNIIYYVYLCMVRVVRRRVAEVAGV